ncbi:hypothetical protein [Streptomyces sp. NPDC001068]|uniref:hypothetical protein n=1 Tax=Streptomyces sp. NPDC001068 TaxID=3364544 RepID=UPI003690FC43
MVYVPDPKTYGSKPTNANPNQPHPAPAGPKPETTVHHTPTPFAYDPAPVKAPAVPGGGGGGSGTSVSTPSLELFARNIDALIKPVQDAAARMEGVRVAPGAFYDANVMRTKVTGTDGHGGLKQTYTAVLDILATGLTDMRDGMRKLSRDYARIEDANGMSAKKLAEAFANTPDDFDQMMAANGGSSSNGSGSGGNSGGSGGGGNSGGGGSSGGSSGGGKA